MNVHLIYPHWPETYRSFRHALKFQGKRGSIETVRLHSSSKTPPHISPAARRWHRGVGLEALVST
jgi:hypothetical protein